MYDKDVVTGGRKMGRYGETNGISMSAPHPYTDVELNSTAVAEAGREHNKQTPFIVVLLSLRNYPNYIGWSKSFNII